MGAPVQFYASCRIITFFGMSCGFLFLFIYRIHVHRRTRAREELDDAVRVLVLESQRVRFAVSQQESSYNHHISSKPLARLSPLINAVGVIRVGDRWCHALVSYERKRPILLAKKSHLALSSCERCHSGSTLMCGTFICLVLGHVTPRGVV